MICTNEARTRAWTRTPFGVACYTVEGGVGHHEGLVRDVETAERWLRGEDVEIVRVYY